MHTRVRALNARATKNLRARLRFVRACAYTDLYEIFFWYLTLIL